jgi:hypothetical protein
MSATARHASSTPTAGPQRGQRAPGIPAVPVLAPGEGTVVALPGATMI